MFVGFDAYLCVKSKIQTNLRTKNTSKSPFRLQKKTVLSTLKTQIPPSFLFSDKPLISLRLFLAPNLLCAKKEKGTKNSSVFHRNASFPPGYWCFFLAGVMIWWIRIWKPGTIPAFMLAFLCHCRLLTSCSNPHFSHEYKYLFGKCQSCSRFGWFSTIKGFVGAAGCRAKALQCARKSPSLTFTQLFIYF